MSKELDISNIETMRISVDNYVCNVNRLSTNIARIDNFEDTIPMFSEDEGPYIQIYNGENEEKQNVPLTKDAYTSMLVVGAQNMTLQEYSREFVKLKKEFVIDLIKKTYSKDFQEPIGIQKLAIPELIQKRDALVQFKSGTGKTHAFLFGCLWGFDPNDVTLQYVFITSTHEVAMQIYSHAQSLLPESAKIYLCIGNRKSTETKISDGNLKGGFRNVSTLSFGEKRTLRQEREDFCKAQVIIGTIGKFHDYFCTRKWLNQDNYEYMKALCIDEFDRIIKSSSRNPNDVSTEKQVSEIIEKIPKNTQRVFFSATVPIEAFETAFSYFRNHTVEMGDPFIVLLDVEDSTLDGIKQYYVKTPSFQIKKQVLMDLIRQLYISQAIVFTNTIDTALQIKNLLTEQSLPIPSEIFHGKMSSVERKQIYTRFINREIRILISTDVTSRGLDVQSINIVINFDMPENIETYIHRVGRSGRFGRKGVSISFIMTSCNSKKDGEYQKVISINERSKNSKMVELPEDLSKLL